MKKLIRGEHYNQEIAMHAGYHLEITAAETAYLVSGEDCFGRRAVSYTHLTLPTIA